MPFWVIFKSVKIRTLTNRCHPELRLETTETSCELRHMDELQHVSKRPLTCEQVVSLSVLLLEGKCSSSPGQTLVN